MSAPTAAQQSTIHEQRRWLIVAILIILMAAALRMDGLVRQGMWNDEGLSYARARLPLRPMLRQLPAEQMPTYYVALYLWMRAFGQDLWTIRVLSAGCGVMATALAISLGRKLGGTVGLIGGALLAISPTAIYQSQTARMYPLMLVWLLFSARLAVDLTTDHSPWRFAAYVATATAAILTHLTAGLAVAALALWGWAALHREQSASRRWLAAQVASVALVACWPLYAWLSGTPQANLGSTGAQSAAPQDILIKATQALISAPEGDGAWQPALLALPLLALAVLGIAGGRRRKDALLTLAWLVPVVTLAGLFALSAITRAPLYWHYLAPLSVWLYLAVGAGIERLAPWRWAQALALLLALAPMLWFLQIYHQRPVEDLAPLAAHIATQAQPGDVVVHSSTWRAQCFSYYDQAKLPSVSEPNAIKAQTLLSEAQRLWIVVYGYRPTPVIADILMARSFELGNWPAGTTLLHLYQAPQATDATWIPSEAVLTDAAGGRIRLLGYALQTLSGNPTTLQVTIHWQLVHPVEPGYKVFIHLRDEQGTLWGQRDAQPVDGTRPTWTWQVGETIIDRHAVPLQANAPAGEYELVIGLYEGATRLQVLATPDGPPTNALLLQTLRLP